MELSLNNSEIAEIGIIIKDFEKKLKRENREIMAKKNQKKRRKRVGYFRNTYSESAHHSDIYRKAIIAEFLRGK